MKFDIRNDILYRCYPEKDETTAIIPDGVTIIEAGAFERLSLEYIIIPEGVTVIKDNAFFACRNLKELTFPSSLQLLCNAVNDCDDLKSVTFLGNTSIAERNFLTCSSLEKVIKPKNTTENSDTVNSGREILDRFAKILEEEMELYYYMEESEEDLESGILKCELDDWCVGVITNEHAVGNYINVYYKLYEKTLIIELHNGKSENEEANQKVLALLQEVKPAGLSFDIAKGQICGRAIYENVELKDMPQIFQQFKAGFKTSAVYFDILSVMDKGYRGRKCGYRICYDD